jgi:hypothetical protein
MKYAPLKSKMDISEINKEAQKLLAERRDKNAAYEKWLMGGSRMSQWAKRGQRPRA